MPETAFEAVLSLYYLIWGKGIPLFGTVKGKPLLVAVFLRMCSVSFAPLLSTKQTDIHPLT